MALETKPFIPQPKSNAFYDDAFEIAALPDGQVAVLTFDNEKEAHDALIGLQRASADTNFRIVKRLVNTSGKTITLPNGEKELEDNGWTIGQRKNRAGETVEGYVYTSPKKTVLYVSARPRKESGDDVAEDTGE